MKKHEIIARDGKCLHCGTSANLTVDHIIPKVHGGSDHETNLQTLCFSCNQKKGSHRKLTLLQRLRYVWTFPELFENFQNYTKQTVAQARAAAAKADHQTRTVHKKLDKSFNKLCDNGELLDDDKQLDLLLAFQNIEERLSRLEK